ncbi:MAG: VanW family protein [Patescibacteria group bacterium]
MSTRRNLLGKSKKHRRLVIDGLFAIGIVAVLAAVGLLVPQAYAKTILPGVWVGDVAVGGKTVDEATALLQSHADAVVEAGLVVTVDGKATTVPIQQALTTSDLTPPLVDVGVEQSVAGAQSYGHDFGMVRNAAQFWRAALFRKHVAAAVETDEVVVENVMRKVFGAKDDPPENAHLQFANGTFTVTPEKAGRGFEYEPAVRAAMAQWKNVQPASVTLQRGEDKPRLKVNDLEGYIDDAQAVVARAPFTLTLPDGTTATLDAAAAGAALDVLLVKGSKKQLVFSESRLAGFTSTLQKRIDVEVKDARFKIVGGKVTEFQAGQVGRALDVGQTIAAMTAAFVDGKAKTLAVVSKDIQPQSADASAESLGITELVATGKTNFAGSPTNRRKNIANAVRLLNGLLIKPGEEFSLVQALSPIEISNGYLPELVIKGNRTIPEVGGGLCQVATTAFRLAMDAGLPITARRNHSYRVSYYEPPVGMDATIYDPAPDFKFKNDYATALLLQTRVSGDNLIFDFYGTKDSRVASTTTPKLFGVTKPPPAKYIKTTDLAPGQKKRLERAHNGGSASFTYTVVKDGKTTNKVFDSKYRAWQEVWLVGATAEEVAAESEA